MTASLSPKVSGLLFSSVSPGAVLSASPPCPAGSHAGPKCNRVWGSCSLGLCWCGCIIGNGCFSFAVHLSEFNLTPLPHVLGWVLVSYVFFSVWFCSIWCVVFIITLVRRDWSFPVPTSAFTEKQGPELDQDCVCLSLCEKLLFSSSSVPGD